MAMVPAQCTNCGANIIVDETKEAGICEACGTAYITEKVINNYHVTNHYHADVINPANDGFDIQAGVLVKYNGSQDTVMIPDNVKAIGRRAFFDLKGLASVTITDSVHTIEPEAFLWCKSLTTVVLPSSIKTIPESCFSGCDSLMSIEIPNGCTKIEKYAFNSCINLSRIILPDSVVEIEESAFANCKSLESLLIPASVTTIQGHGSKYSEKTKKFYGVESCFTGCSSLKRVTFKGDNTEIHCSPYLSLFDTTYSYQIEIRASESWKSQNEKKLASIRESTSQGCYIATCVYGSYDCPEVWTLRRYRDNTLGSTWYGRWFIMTYYAVSPTLVKWFGKTKWFKKLWRGKLDRMVKILQERGVESTPYCDKEW